MLAYSIERRPAISEQHSKATPQHSHHDPTPANVPGHGTSDARILDVGTGPVEGAGMSFRLAAYAVCIKDGRVLLARHVPPKGETNWTLPGGRVEHAEDPFDAVIREVAEETGYASVVERLLGVDSRVIPAA